MQHFIYVRKIVKKEKAMMLANISNTIYLFTL